MHRQLTRERLLLLMRELARTAPRTGSFRVYLLGGGTAVHLGWRTATIDVDLFADRDAVFRDIQGIKERLEMNIEFARPEDFVPPLKGTSGRHLFIDKIAAVAYYHYDPYAQLLSKIVRGFQRDLEDAASFLDSGLVDANRFRSLISGISDAAYAKYPSLSRRGVESAVGDFLALRD